MIFKDNRLKPEAVDRLLEIVSSDRLITETELLLDYSHDESPHRPCVPVAVVKPVSVEEVARIVQFARGERIPLTPRGLGTGLAGGSVPVHGGLVVSMELMNRILEIDTENLMVRTEPGVVTARLQEACAAHGLYYPVDPASLVDCSIGGNVATNAGGARAFKYGVTGDYVTGVQAVLADGSVINYGGKLRKNATGYDLNRLLVGSEGTLGIVTEITFRLVPKPAYQVDLLVPCRSMTQAVELVIRLVQERRVMPAVVEFFDKKGTDASIRVLGENLPFPDAPVQVLIELEGNDREVVSEDALRLGEMAMALGTDEPLVAEDASSQGRLWKTRRSLAKTLKQFYPEVIAEDIVVPVSRLAETVEFICQLESRFGLVIVPFGHIGDGNIHTDFCRNESDRAGWQERVNRAVDELIDFVVRAGGQITAEHGIGALKKRLMKKGLGEAELRLMRHLKQTLDPDNILNPGKVLPDD
ncbi:MAG: FAD-binding oxidoreductase [candidate division WOR-3 bacterium]